MTSENLLERESHFAFGKNWLEYTTKIDERAINSAMNDLRRLSGGSGLDGKTFLDIGCGSGIHALAALRLGARKVCCIDIDEDSVVAATKTIQTFAPSAEASFKVCSVFDLERDALGSFDVIYSWGVLHHTGDMRRAVAIAAGLVEPGGEFYLALYKRTRFCGMWKVIKRLYSRAGSKNQAHIRTLYSMLLRVQLLATGSSYRSYASSYQNSRGMDVSHDQHDWLGGYPYDSITPAECRAMLSGLGLVIDREFIQQAGYLTGLLSSGCDEYACSRQARSDNLSERVAAVQNG